MRDMFGIRERVVEHAMKFYPDIVTSAEALNLFKFSPRMTKGGGPGSSTLDAPT